MEESSDGAFGAYTRGIAVLGLAVHVGQCMASGDPVGMKTHFLSLILGCDTFEDLAVGPHLACNEMS